MARDMSYCVPAIIVGSFNKSKKRKFQLSELFSIEGGSVEKCCTALGITLAIEHAVTFEVFFFLLWFSTRFFS